MKSYKIALVPGDGIGVDVTDGRWSPQPTNRNHSGSNRRHPGSRWPASSLRA
ncbi:MAG: hypothetical protein ABJO97_06505 [Roseibium sp.]|uniref:hypothetical protein n=1 Tax=Roseibium sp. TaxID=1936156 RepID=UPI003296E426